MVFRGFKLKEINISTALDFSNKSTNWRFFDYLLPMSHNLNVPFFEDFLKWDCDMASSLREFSFRWLLKLKPSWSQRSQDPEKDAVRELKDEEPPGWNDHISLVWLSEEKLRFFGALGFWGLGEMPHCF